MKGGGGGEVKGGGGEVRGGERPFAPSLLSNSCLFSPGDPPVSLLSHDSPSTPPFKLTWQRHSFGVRSTGVGHRGPHIPFF